MRKFTRPVSYERKLSQNLATEYDSIIDLYNELVKQLDQYPDDEYIEELRNEAYNLMVGLKEAKDVYLATPIEEVITYDVDLEILDEIKRRVENFKKSVAL